MTAEPSTESKLSERESTRRKQQRHLSRILREQEMLAYVGLKKSQVAVMITLGQFPKPLRLTESGRAKGWLETELIEWQGHSSLRATSPKYHGRSHKGRGRGLDIQATRAGVLNSSLPVRHVRASVKLRFVGCGPDQGIASLFVDSYLLAPRACRPRRIVRVTERARHVLAAMQAGKTLHLQFHDGQPLWSLSDGRPVPGAVAALLITNASVVPAGNALFSLMPGQVWRLSHD